MFKSWLSDLEKRVIDLSGKDYTPRFFSFECLLVILSRVYGAGARLRLAMYKLGVLKQKRLPCFVISIGNIVAGGSGKTPMAVYLADSLVKMGFKPVVVSRGYKGKLGKLPGIVGDGHKVFMDPETAGDEPFMMARLRRFPVVVGKDRYAAGRLALDKLDVDVVILDDGFQHMGLARDVNLVLFDHDHPLGNGRVLPAGRLRETPNMARERIHGIILTRCPDALTDRVCSVELPVPIGNAFHGTPFFHTRHQSYLSGFYSKDSNVDIPHDCSSLKNQRAVLFSGVARNDSFRETVRGIGVKVLAHLEFSDHYRYKRADFIDIRNQSETLNADVILTTEKDWVKMDKGFDWGRDLAVIGIRIGFEAPDAFDGFVELKLNT